MDNENLNKNIPDEFNNPENLNQNAPSIDEASFANMLDNNRSEGKNSISEDNNETTDYSARIQILEAELERTKDQMIRALAEADNIRKRSLREREDAAKYAISSFSKDLLSVADNLRRALNAVPQELAESTVEIKNLLSGIEATERELLKTFDKNGIQKIEPLDAQFDPHFHEVMFEAVIPDKAAGTIIQVIESGYILNGRILRPARVGVAKNTIATGGHAVDTQA